MYEESLIAGKLTSSQAVTQDNQSSRRSMALRVMPGLEPLPYTPGFLKQPGYWCSRSTQGLGEPRIPGVGQPMEEA